METRGKMRKDEKGLEGEKITIVRALGLLEIQVRGELLEYRCIAWRVDIDHHPPPGFIHHCCVLWILEGDYV